MSEVVSVWYRVEFEVDDRSSVLTANVGYYTLSDVISDSIADFAALERHLALWHNRRSITIRNIQLIDHPQGFSFVISLDEKESDWSGDSLGERSSTSSSSSSRSSSSSNSISDSNSRTS